MSKTSGWMLQDRTEFVQARGDLKRKRHRRDRLNPGTLSTQEYR